MIKARLTTSTVVINPANVKKTQAKLLSDQAADHLDGTLNKRAYITFKGVEYSVIDIVKTSGKVIVLTDKNDKAVRASWLKSELYEASGLPVFVEIEGKEYPAKEVIKNKIQAQKQNTAQEAKITDEIKEIDTFEESRQEFGNVQDHANHQAQDTTQETSSPIKDTSNTIKMLGHIIANTEETQNLINLITTTLSEKELLDEEIITFVESLKQSILHELIKTGIFKSTQIKPNTSTIKEQAQNKTTSDTQFQELINQAHKLAYDVSITQHKSQVTITFEPLKDQDTYSDQEHSKLKSLIQKTTKLRNIRLDDADDLFVAFTASSSSLSSSNKGTIQIEGNNASTISGVIQALNKSKHTDDYTIVSKSNTTLVIETTDLTGVESFLRGLSKDILIYPTIASITAAPARKPMLLKDYQDLLKINKLYSSDETPQEEIVPTNSDCNQEAKCQDTESYDSMPKPEQVPSPSFFASIKKIFK